VLSNELENCLSDTFHRAREARHEYLTVEHLLLGIVDTQEVREVLGACGADLAQLKQELQDKLDQSTPRFGQSDAREVQATIGFQRVLQRAVFHVQSSGKREVGVVNVLVAIFSEHESEAVSLLKRHHVTRADAVKYIVGPPSARAWLWASTQRQDELVTDLRDFARDRGLRFNVDETPSPAWRKIGVILVTPGDNEIWIINATAEDRFEVSLRLVKPEAHWHACWDDLKARISSRYKWEDVPGAHLG